MNPFAESWNRHDMSTFGILIPSGVPDRFPCQKIVSAENNCGWLPYYWRRMDRGFAHFGPSGTATPRRTQPTLKPSEYFRRRMHYTFIGDWFGVASRQWIGMYNIMWSSDYPAPRPPGRTRVTLSSVISGTPASWKSARSSERGRLTLRL